MSRHRIEVSLPSWLDRMMDAPPVLDDTDSRMRWAIDLARRNVVEGTGGPFGALVLDDATGQVLSGGVNLVLPTRNCTAHAEMVAIELAEKTVSSFDLSADGHRTTLVTSVEPCAMCLGAIVWSGVRSVVCGAPSEAATEIGFDEGPRTPRWVDALECRGIQVTRGVLAADATAVLREYAAGGGVIYNAGRRDLT
jgi:tRNA(Arg) A34 adenosine deaminase TadA